MRDCIVLNSRSRLTPHCKQFQKCSSHANLAAPVSAWTPTPFPQFSPAELLVGKPLYPVSVEPNRAIGTSTAGWAVRGPPRVTLRRLVGWLWTKHHILLGPRCYFTSDPPLVELSPCSKDGQGEGEAAVIAHQPISQGIETGTTESVEREQSPEPPAPP